MALGDDLLKAVGDAADSETAMEARVQAAIDALNASIAALKANPTADQTTQAINMLQAEKDKLTAFQANPAGPPPATVAP